MNVSKTFYLTQYSQNKIQHVINIKVITETFSFCFSQSGVLSTLPSTVPWVWSQTGLRGPRGTAASSRTAQLSNSRCPRTPTAPVCLCFAPAAPGKGSPPPPNINTVLESVALGLLGRASRKQSKASSQQLWLAGRATGPPRGGLEAVHVAPD